MYRGKYQLGNTVQLMLLTRNASGTPSVPTDVPVMKVWNAGGTQVRNKEMPVTERYAQTGLFYYPLFLDSDFSVGHYVVTYAARVGSDYVVEEDDFEIVAGGNADGDITNLYFYSRPHADFVVQSLESGRIAQGRGPKV